MFLSCRQQWEPKKIVIDNLATHKTDKEGYNLNPDRTPELIESYDDFKKRVNYPDYEKTHRIQGKVFIMAFINEKGNVDKSNVIIGIDSSLNYAAMHAVDSTKFYPATIEGKPVKARLSIPISFVLNDYKIGETLFNGAAIDYPSPYSDYMKGFDKVPEPIGGINAIMRLVVYPKEELKNKVEGKVYISTFIDEYGKVIYTTQARSGNHNFMNAAAQAIKKVKFTPAESYGKKVKSRITIPVQFKLD